MPSPKKSQNGLVPVGFRPRPADRPIPPAYPHYTQYMSSLPVERACGALVRTTLQDVARSRARSSDALKKLSRTSAMPVAALAAAITSEALTNERGGAI